jgi:carboxyl-terminal processing protease
LLLGLSIGALVSAVFVSGFAFGTAFGRSHPDRLPATSDPNVRDFLTAYQLVTQRSYFRPLNKRQLMYAAIDGMLTATGDPHTVFLSPQDNQSAQQQLNGSSFSGIGAIVVPQGRTLQVVAPLPNSPSTRAGLRAGDRVTAIDGQPVARMTGDQAVTRIHGPSGTTVRLTVLRGHRGPFVVSVKRQRIAPITAYGRLLSHRIGYIQILSFGDTTRKQVAQALSLLTSQGVRSIVLDLRDNPGGYVDAAQAVVSDFVPHGVVAYEENANRELTPLLVARVHKVVHLPLAVLVNAGTASAAELTAGALRDDVHAVLIGTRTYGKGSMQSVYPLQDGSSLRITDRLWLTPLRHSIQKTGLEPNIVVGPGQAAQGSDADPQLTAAERYLTVHRTG